MVQEGKLSPEDAAELIDAFTSSDDDAEPSDGPPPPPKEAGGDAESSDRFKSFIDYIEGIGRDISQSVNWHDVAKQVRTGAKKGVESIREGIDRIKKDGKFGFEFFGAQEVRKVEMPLLVSKGKTLRIENPVGDIRILGGAKSGTVVATAKFRGADPEEARKRAAAYSLIIEESEQFVLVKQPDVSGVQVDFELQLASKSPIEVRALSGNVTVEGTGAGCKVSANSGEITLSGLNGVIDVTSQSGSVSIADSSAPALSVENKSGDVTITGVKGNINIRTASGDLRLIDCAGKTISVESVSGDIECDISEPIEGNVSIRTVNGNSLVEIPDGSDCRVSLSTLRGRVTSLVELKDEAKSDLQITGSLGSGKGSMDVSAVNGSISLCLRDSSS